MWPSSVSTGHSMKALCRRSPGSAGSVSSAACRRSSRRSVEVARARRYRGRLSLVLFDLDRFKEINDRDGHPEGDRLLRAFAAALNGTARLTDVLGRLGGDEFGALLLEVEPGRVASFLERLRARLAEGPAASAGAAFLPDEGSTAERLVALADRRLYADKAAR